MHITSEMIGRMDTTALRNLNGLIVGEIKQRMARETYAKAREFLPGDKVSFRNKHGAMVMARVDKINTKSIGCTELKPDGTSAFRTWRVSPGLLTKVFG